MDGLQPDAAGEGRLTDVQPLELSARNAYLEGMLEAIRRLYGLGLADRMAFGSDAGPLDTEFGRPDLNVELARVGGLSPMESLQVLTRTAARACGLADSAGTLRAGLAGDLLVLDADPLQDQYAMQRVLGVSRSGWRVA